MSPVRAHISHSPGAKEERPSVLCWKRMHAADAYGLQISKQHWNDAPLAKRQKRKKKSREAVM